MTKLQRINKMINENLDKKTSLRTIVQHTRLLKIQIYLLDNPEKV